MNCPRDLFYVLSKNVIEYYWKVIAIVARFFKPNLFTNINTRDI